MMPLLGKPEQRIVYASYFSSITGAIRNGETPRATRGWGRSLEVT